MNKNRTFDFSPLAVVRDGKPLAANGRRGLASLVATLLAVVLAAAACSGSPSSSTSASAKSHDAAIPVTMSIPTYAANFGPYLAAVDKGYYAQQGLNVSITKLSGESSVAGLLSGSVQFAGAAGSAVPAILSGQPVVNISVNTDSPPYLIVAKTSINNLAGLKGQKLGIQTLGDSIQVSTNELLEKNGITPSSVDEIPIGLEPAPLTALENGAVPAAVFAAPQLSALDKTSDASQFHVIGRMEGNVYLPIAGTTVSRAFLTSHASEVREFLYATAEGAKYFLDHPSYAISLLAKDGDGTTANATADYDYCGVWPLSGGVSLTQQEQAIDEFASANHLHAGSPSKVYDFKIANSVYAQVFGKQSSGTVTKNTLPTS